MPTLPPVTLIPALAVTIPTESILVTSSYVSVPPILTLPETDRSPLISPFPLTSSPVEVIIPVELIL